MVKSAVEVVETSITILVVVSMGPPFSPQKELTGNDQSTVKEA